jgi:hypothetical protein
MREYARLVPAYDLTAKLASAVYRSDPLASEQIDRVAQILASASTSFQQGRPVDRSSINWSIAFAEAQSVLSQGQLAALVDLQRQLEYQGAAQKIAPPR